MKSTTIDLIGIGALNLDFISSRDKVKELDPDVIPEYTNKFELGAEKYVNDEEIDLTVNQMGVHSFETFLGGSSFNTIRAVAYSSRDIKIGYIGVAGDTYPHQNSFIDRMEHLGIETCYVKKETKPSGRCISYISEGERSLLTSPGVNINVAEYLKDNRNELLNYISRAKIIHVTSFFDDATPKVLLEILKDAKKMNPWLKISFDPGHEWIVNMTDSIKGFLNIADFIFLNYREFQLLGHHRPGSKDYVVARNIFKKCSSDSILIILKKYDCIKLFYNIHKRLMRRKFTNVVIPQEEIQDATGAGDIFAAGFLISWLIPGLEISHGVTLGLELVRAKLLVAGYSCFESYSNIFYDFIQKVSNSVCGMTLCGLTTKDIKSGVVSNSIFLGHGGNPVWYAVEKHLNKLNLSCITFESENQVGRHNLERLRECLDNCNFAIILMTAEDTVNENDIRARQNVLHEIGLFQGRLGFTKVAILKQSGVQSFSNIDGLQYISFEGNKIEQAFHSLDEYLKKAQII